MKINKLILLIASTLLLTISSGLLFYKNLFLINSPHANSKIDFDEIHTTDLQINATVLLMRKNLSTDSSVLESEINRMKELVNILADVNKKTTQLEQSVKQIQDYYKKRDEALTNFTEAIKDLKFAIDSLSPGLNELNKHNLKFSVDKKDFYLECVVSALFYVATSTKESENRLVENRKILGQILSYANNPNPIIQKFTNYVDIILKRNKEIEKFTETFTVEIPIMSEINSVNKFLSDSQEEQSHNGETFLSFVFGTIVLYVLCLIFFIKKLS